MRKFKIQTILSFIFLFVAESSLINAQVSIPQLMQTPEPEIYLTVDKNVENNLLRISLMYNFPDNFYQNYDPDFFKAEIISPAEFLKYNILFPGK